MTTGAAQWCSWARAAAASARSAQGHCRGASACSTCPGAEGAPVPGTVVSSRSLGAPVFSTCRGPGWAWGPGGGSGLWQLKADRACWPTGLPTHGGDLQKTVGAGAGPAGRPPPPPPPLESGVAEAALCPETQGQGQGEAGCPPAPGYSEPVGVPYRGGSSLAPPRAQPGGAQGGGGGEGQAGVGILGWQQPRRQHWLAGWVGTRPGRAGCRGRSSWGPEGGGAWSPEGQCRGGAGG